MVMPNACDIKLIGFVSGKNKRKRSFCLIRRHKTYSLGYSRIEFSFGKLYLWIVICILLLSILGFRLYELQVKSQSFYVELSKNNHDRIVSLECPRGTIFDRNGIKLAEDIPTYHLYANLQQTFNLMDKNTKKEEKIKFLTSILTKTIQSPEKEILNLLTKNKDNTDEFLVRNNLDNTEYARFNEKSFELPGFFVKEGFKRYYPKGSLLAHMIGYTRVISQEQKKDSAFKNYDSSERVGKSGIELYYEKILHGIKGQKVQTINALGNIIDEHEIANVVKGDNIYLTIDSTLQAIAEETIKDNVGTIIVIDVNSGEILACASNPTFDPNIFSKPELPVLLWQELEQKRAFYNIAVQGQYPPGSTFKPLLSLYALEKNILTTTTQIYCGGSIKVPNLSEKYRCWVYPSMHGLLNLKEALKLSCDVFFYELGRRCNIEDILAYVTRFGIGKRTGIDINETEEGNGFIGNPTWKKKQEGYPWFEGDSMNLGIGQGFIDVTPMQMAKIYAQLGNGGKIVIPHLLKKTSKGKVFADFLTDYQKNMLTTKINPNEENIKTIHEDLYAVTEAGGTATGLYNSQIRISGKTGTAEGAPGKNGKSKQHLWLSSFAPTEKPEIAAVCLFEDSELEFGGNIAPYLKKVILAYFDGIQHAGGNDAK
jgi:penicillin-binding protein 2